MNLNSYAYASLWVCIYAAWACWLPPAMFSVVIYAPQREHFSSRVSNGPPKVVNAPPDVVYAPVKLLSSFDLAAPHPKLLILLFLFSLPHLLAAAVGGGGGVTNSRVYICMCTHTEKMWQSQVRYITEDLVTGFHARDSVTYGTNNTIVH